LKRRASNRHDFGGNFRPGPAHAGPGFLLIRTKNLQGATVQRRPGNPENTSGCRLAVTQSRLFGNVGSITGVPRSGLGWAFHEHT
jgi:hypothetical protein